MTEPIRGPVPPSAARLHTFTLARDRAAIRSARHQVAGLLDGRGYPPSTVHAAVVVTSELVANAISHADGRPAVTVNASPTAVYVQVTDWSPTRRPDLVRPVAGPSGLQLVAAFSDTWGVEVHVDRKSVWARLPV